MNFPDGILIINDLGSNDIFREKMPIRLVLFGHFYLKLFTQCFNV
jgi:hypothetical protein